MFDGAKPNHHATMIRDPVNREEAENMDPIIDGVLIEVSSNMPWDSPRP